MKAAEHWPTLEVQNVFCFIKFLATLLPLHILRAQPCTQDPLVPTDTEWAWLGF